jgi:hypothetical protein
MANNKKSRSTIDANRSSITGRFVTHQYANRHTKTTEHERIKKGK